MITIAIIDDHPVSRWGLERLFGDHDEIRVAASVPTPHDLDRDERFDVVILDLYLESDAPAISTIRTLAARQPVLVLSAAGRQADVLAALRSGAVGYVAKEADNDEMTRAVRTVAAGGFYLSGTLANFIQADLHRRATARPALTAREAGVLSHIAQGFTHAQTATRMNIEQEAVDRCVEGIRRKLGLGQAAGLTRGAIELNPDDEDHPGPADM